MKKKIIIPLLLLISLLVISCLAILIRSGNKPLKNNGNTISIQVNKGDTLYSVFDKLNNEQKMTNLNLTKIYIKLNKIKSDIKEGTYEVPDNVTVKELIDILDKGNTLDEITFTVPEGYNIDNIASKLDKEGIVKKEDFISAIESYKDIPKYVKKDSKRRYALEGYLFPETYKFKKDITATEIIDIMLKQFDNVFKNSLKELNMTINDVNVDDIVTKASVIEEEAKSDEDRYLISSVIDNRIDKKMMLQIDATVIYAHGYHKDVLYNKDLKIDSKYNTYKYYGLPVGPIASPGKESLKAALNPKKTDYIYYIWTGEGDTHFFTNSYNEFLKKKNEVNR